DPLSPAADAVAFCPDTTCTARVVVDFGLPSAPIWPATVGVPAPPRFTVGTPVVVDGTSPLPAAPTVVVAGRAVVVVAPVVVVATVVVVPRGGALPYASGTVTYQVS